MLFIRATLCLSLLFASLRAFPLQVTLLAHIKVRLIQGQEALDYDAAGTNYLLKAGSVIEIPDAVVVYDSAGKPDLLDSLTNWVNNPEHKGSFNGQAGNYFLHNEGEIAATEAKPLVPVKIVKAAEGSIVPANGIAHLGLAPMAIMQKLEVTAGPIVLKAPEIVDGNPAVTLEDITDLPAPSSSGVVGAGEELGAAHVEAVTEIIGQGNNAAATAGTDAVVCPDGGNCTSTAAGKEEPATVACEYVFKYGFPGDLADTHLSNHDDYTVIAAWFQGKMAVPEECKDSCPTANAAALANLTKACSVLETCSQGCSTPKIDGFWCKNGYSREEENCKDTCSPFRGMSYSQRSRELKAFYKQAFNDLAENSPALGAKIKKSGNADKQAMRMLCLNHIRENPDLEPMDANCDSSALGFGQVLKGTFYETFGLSSQNLDRCMDIKVGELIEKCRGLLTDVARFDIYDGKYDNLTPRQVYHRRAFDIEIQVRSSYGAWVNKMKYAGYNSDSAFYLWFGKSDSSKRRQINTCTENGAA